MAAQDESSSLRLPTLADTAIPVAILTLTALVIAAVPLRSWAGHLAGKRRKLAHPLPPHTHAQVDDGQTDPDPVPVAGPSQVSAAPPPGAAQGVSALAGRGKRSKDRRKRDNKARAARRDEVLAVQYVEALAAAEDAGRDPRGRPDSDPLALDRALAPAAAPSTAPDGTRPPFPALVLEAALLAPLPPDSDDDDSLDTASVAESHSTNPTSIGLPTPLSLSATETLPVPPLSLADSGWYVPPKMAPRPPSAASSSSPGPQDEADRRTRASKRRPRSPHAEFGSLDPHPPPRAGHEAQLSGLRKELAKALMETDRASKNCEIAVTRCDELERELDESRRRESDAQTQIQQLMKQLHLFQHAQQRPMPMPMPIPVGMPFAMHPLHAQQFAAAAHQQRGSPVPFSPVPFSPVLHAQQNPPAYNGQYMTPMYAHAHSYGPPQAPAEYAPRAATPSELVAEAILRRPEILGADES